MRSDSLSFGARNRPICLLFFCCCSICVRVRCLASFHSKTRREQLFDAFYAMTLPAPFSRYNNFVGTSPPRNLCSGTAAPHNGQRLTILPRQLASHGSAPLPLIVASRNASRNASRH